jgi:hypothetical protein
MYFKPVRYSPKVENRINRNPKLLDKTEIENNIYFGIRIMERGRRFYVIYLRENQEK